MKVTPAHREHMKEAMVKRMQSYTPDALASYLESIKTDPRVKDWRKRYRWDLCHASGLTPWLCSTVYPYANDTHIDTALKAIMTEIA